MGQARNPAGSVILGQGEHDDVAIRLDRFPVDARVEGERLRVRLNDGPERTVDHVVLGTGYRIDVSRYPFLSPQS